MKKLLLALFLFSGFNSFSQGYLGKRQEANIDLLQLALYKQINLSYKYCTGEFTAMSFNFNETNTSRDMKKDVDRRLFSTDAQGYSTIYVNASDLNKSRVSCNNVSFTLGFLQNPPQVNIPMPIGAYYGLAIQYLSGTIIDEYEKNGISSKYEYKQSEFVFKTISGNNIFIKSNFTIDLDIEYGFVLGNLKDKNIGEQHAIYEKEPYSELPPPIPFMKKRSFIQSEIGKFSYVRFKLQPHIKIGYIF